MPKIIPVLLSALACLVGSPCRASQQDGTIQNYTLPRIGPGALIVSGNRTAAPVCATDPTWSFDGSTSNGAQLVAGIMTARENGRNVTVVGTGTCDPNSPSREMINWIHFN